MMTLNGCATSGGNPKLQVQIPAECEKNMSEVSDPDYKKGDDPVVVAAKYKAKMGLANKKLRDARKCQQQVRSNFAKGGI